MPQASDAAKGALRLLPLSEVRADDIAAAINDFEVARWLSRVPYPSTVADAEAFLAATPPDAPVRAIADGNGFAGMVGLDPGLGYWLARRAWGRGYAYRAARMLLTRHFLAEDPDPVTSGHFEGNVRSARILERLGFRHTHDETVTPPALGHEVLLHRSRLTRDDWWRDQGLPLRTGRLTLRPMLWSDAALLRSLVTQPEVGRMLFLFPGDWTDGVARDFIADWADPAGQKLRLSVTDASDAFMGTVGVGEGDEPPVFYVLDPMTAGHGYATEAMCAFVAYLFDRRGVAALTASVFTDNPASVRVLEKIGFRQVDKGVSTSAQRLEPAPVWKYRLSRQAFVS